VEGRVLLDGKPLKNVQVTFIPDTSAKTFGPSSTAVTDEEGHYRLVCEERARRPGAIVGAHRITLIDLDATASSSAGHKPGGANPESQEKGKSILPFGMDKSSNTKGKAKPRLAAEYIDLAKTPLKRQVQPGSQTIDLEVTGGGKGGASKPSGDSKRGR
jgi:hypothetical protein